MGKLDVDGWTINDLLEYYDDEKILVDQRYQRKLVWSLKDKAYFIDSIINNYPIPTIMMVEYVGKNEEDTKYGIIDGLQRINSVISFLLGEFKVNIEGKEGYFNFTCSRATFSMLQEGILEPQEPSLTLEKSFCDNFLKKKLPIVTTQHDDSTIDEIFRRVNSTGTKLSVHDLRQAGSTNDFSQLVRNISSAVRKSKTATDKINIADVPQISISNNGLAYGIDINEIFWKKNGLLTDNFIRQSRDEEIIATLLGSFLLDRSVSVISNTILNNLYSDNNDDSRIAQENISQAKENIYTLFVSIFNDLEGLGKAMNCQLADILYLPGTKHKVEIFMILFKVLLANHFESKEIGDYLDFASTIKENRNIFNDLNKKKNLDQITEVSLLKQLDNILSSHFVPIDGIVSPLANEVLTRLSYSKLENKYTEYKIGLTHFKDGVLNKKNVKKIAKVACSMANVIKPTDKSFGMIIIGIADSEEDYANWFERYKKPSYQYMSHRIVGVDKEAEVQYKKVENLVEVFRNYIDCLPISSEMKQVLKNIEAITVHGKTVLVICISDLSKQEYAGIKYIRKDSQLIPISDWTELE